MRKVHRRLLFCLWVISCPLISIHAAGQVARLDSPATASDSQKLLQPTNRFAHIAQVGTAGGTSLLSLRATVSEEPAQEPDSQDVSGTDQKPNTQKKEKGTASGKAGDQDKDKCSQSEESLHTDCRGVFQASFYIGLAIDTFAGNETLKYLNPGDSGNTHERAIGGLDFSYRLIGDRIPKIKFREKNKNGEPCDPSENEDCKNWDWHPKNLWVYGQTIHGVRSVDINCTQNPDLPTCVKSLTIPSNPGEQLYFVLRNATSLEGFMGFRWEFLGLQQKSSSPANLYLKAEAGFLSVAGAPGSALDVDDIALGAIATKGKYENSFLEVGFGRSDMFSTARRKRVKIDGYLERSLPITGVSLFAELVVDTDLGRGSDAMQSFIGLNFDLGKPLSNP